MTETAFPARGLGSSDASPGLTKLEYACILMRVPFTGYAELDVLIRKARHQEAAMSAMQGMFAADRDRNSTDIVRAAVAAAQFLDAEFGG